MPYEVHTWINVNYRDRDLEVLVVGQFDGSDNWLQSWNIYRECGAPLSKKLEDTLSDMYEDYIAEKLYEARDDM